jgi:hypothetical protein
MSFNKSLAKALLLSFIVYGFVSPLKAGYYMPDFFPIGFTGFGGTGYSYWDYAPAPWDDSPYPDVLSYKYGTWAWEDTLLVRSHCNFIGCSDGSEYYYLKAQPTPACTLDYYNQVCLKSNIMLATNAGYMPRRQDFNDDGDVNDSILVDTTWVKEYAGPSSRRWWTIFRSPAYDGGYAPDSFATCSYDKIPQASIWCPMAEYGAKSYAAYFDSTHVSADNFWGYNPFHEEYAMNVFDKYINLNYNPYEIEIF